MCTVCDCKVQVSIHGYDRAVLDTRNGVRGYAAKFDIPIIKRKILIREFKQRRRLGKRRLKNELIFILQISCIQPALLRQNYLKLNT